MRTIKLSVKGQIVIPAEIRRAMGIGTGDQLVVSAKPGSQTITIRKHESIDEMAERFSKFIKPGAKPLMDASAFYQSRKPKL